MVWRLAEQGPEVLLVVWMDPDRYFQSAKPPVVATGSA
jgi:hypothetical protein